MNMARSSRNIIKRRVFRVFLLVMEQEWIFLFDCWFFTSLLEYNCFTMLRQFMLNNKVNQLYVYIYPHIPSLLRLPPTLPIPPLQVVTKHRADLPVLYSCFPLAIYFTFGCIYMSMLCSHFVPASPRVLKSILYICVFIPVLPLGSSEPFFFFFFRFHIYIYVLAYSICFSLPDLLHSVRQTLGPFTSLQITQFCLFL